MVQLQTGAPAPDFSFVSIAGRDVGTSRARGRKLWMAFFRHTRCLFCNLRIHEMILRHPDLAEHINVVGVFQSPPEPVREFVREKSVPFEVIADPDEELYKRFGLSASLAGTFSPKLLAPLAQGYRDGLKLRLGDGTFSRMPADFLINEAGVVVASHYGANLADHIPFSRVESFLA